VGATATTSPRIVWRRDLAVAAALALLAALVFCQVVTFQFLNYDDDRMVTGNADVQKGLSADGIWWAATGFNYGIWMPVTNLTHLADVTLFGDNPAGHHAVNLLWHMAAVALWYLALVALTGRPWESALAVLLFALHPMRAGVVAWVSSRKELTCAVFFALSILLYARHAARPSLPRMAAVTLAGLLAMMGKPMAVTLPAALLLLDAWPLGRLRADGVPPWKQAARLVGEKVPLFLFAAMTAVLAWVGQRDVGAVGLNERLHNDTPRLQNAVVSYARYLWHTLYPVHLTIHDPVLGTRLTFGWFLGAATVLAVVSVVVIALWRRGYPAVAWCWFLGTFTPVIGIVGFANTSMADRYSYIPHMGLFIAVGWGIFAVSRGAAARTAPPPERSPRAAARPKQGAPPRPSRVELACAAALVIMSAATCVWQTSYWHDNERIFTRALAVMPDNALAHINLASVRLAQGNAEEALSHLREAVRCAPNDPLSLMNLGSLLAKLGRNEEAVKEMAARVDDFAYDLGFQAKYAAIMFTARGPEAALPYFKRAVDLSPEDIGARQSYAVCLIQLKRFDEARAELQRIPETDENRSQTKGVMQLLEQAELESKRMKPGS
jgi:Tfp pilus assembly protein PilF